MFVWGVAVCCSVLQCVAVCCSVLQHITLYVCMRQHIVACNLLMPFTLQLNVAFLIVERALFDRKRALFIVKRARFIVKIALTIVKRAVFLVKRAACGLLLSLTLHRIVMWLIVACNSLLTVSHCGLLMFKQVLPLALNLDEMKRPQVATGSNQLRARMRQLQATKSYRQISYRLQSLTGNNESGYNEIQSRRQQQVTGLIQRTYCKRDLSF